MLKGILAIVAVFVATVLLFVGLSQLINGTEPVTYEAQTEERFRELEQRLSAAEDRTELLSRLVTAKGRIVATEVTYAMMIATYYATVAEINAGALDLDVAAERIAIAVRGDNQLSVLWNAVVYNELPVPVFENLLHAKAWAAGASAGLAEMDG